MPEMILPIVFCIALLVLKIKHDEYQFALSARIAMAAMLVTTAIAHFVFTKGMSMMLPNFIPYKTALVYITGIIEAMAAAGILISKYQKLTGVLLIVFFVLIIPANIYSTLNQVDMKNATFEGAGPNYLWYRIPLQVFFIAWVYFSYVRPVGDN